MGKHGDAEQGPDKAEASLDNSEKEKILDVFTFYFSNKYVQLHFSTAILKQTTDWCTNIQLPFMGLPWTAQYLLKEDIDQEARS